MYFLSWRERRFFGFYYTSDRILGGKRAAAGSGYCLCGWGARVGRLDLRIDYCPRRRWLTKAQMRDPDEPYFPKHLSVYWRYRLVFSL